MNSEENQELNSVADGLEVWQDLTIEEVSPDEAGTETPSKEASESSKEPAVAPPPTQPQQPQYQFSPSDIAVLQQAQAAQAAQAYEEIKRSYTLTPEQIEKIRENPEEVIPELMARAQIAAMAQVHRAVQNDLPQRIAATVAQATEYARNEDEFYRNWPELKTPELQGVLQNVAMNFRQAYPTASKEDFIRQVGMQTLLTAGRPLPKRVVQAATQEVQARRTRFKPATPGQPAYAPDRVVQNDFTEIVDDWLQHNT